MNKEEIYKATYMQNPFDILTKENLDKLEKHCKKAIHYERGNLKEEHEIVLQLLYKYGDSIPKQKIRDKIKELENMRNTTITSEGFNIFNGEIVVLKELLEENK